MEVDLITKFVKEDKILISELEKKIMNLEEKNKSYLEIISWIKEAFGENINEDYSNGTLNYLIDHMLTEIKKI
jgi:hypothetical protein